MSIVIKAALILFTLLVGISITGMTVETGFAWFALIIFIGYLYLKMANRDDRYFERPEEAEIPNHTPFSDYVQKMPKSELINRLKICEADFKDNAPEGGFDARNAKEYAMAICLGEFDPELKQSVREALLKIYTGVTTQETFGREIERLVSRSTIALVDWKRAMMVLEKNDQHALNDLAKSLTVQKVSSKDEPDGVYKYKQDDWAQLIDDAELSKDQQSTLLTLGPNWLLSAFTCEHCQGALYKRVFPSGQTLTVTVAQSDESTDEWAVTRVFTCEPCLTFYYPKPGYKLSQASTSKRFSNRQEYKDRLKMLSVKGSF